MDIHWPGPLKLLGRLVCTYQDMHEEESSGFMLFRRDRPQPVEHVFHCRRCGLTQHVNIYYFEPYYGGGRWDDD